MNGLLIIILIYFSILISGFFLFSVIFTAIIGAPFVVASKNIVRIALRACALKENENFYDLGSGTGRALIIASKEFKAKATGFELAFPIFIFSKINILFNGCSKNAKVFNKNFYKQTVADADVVFCWLTPRAIKKLQPKLQKELKPGARIAILSDSFENWPPKESILLPGNHRLFIYSL